MARVMKPGRSSRGRSDPGGKGDRYRRMNKERYMNGWDKIWGDPEGVEEISVDPVEDLKPQHPVPDKPDRETPLKELLKRYQPPW